MSVAAPEDGTDPTAEVDECANQTQKTDFIKATWHNLHYPPLKTLVRILGTWTGSKLSKWVLK